MYRKKHREKSRIVIVQEEKTSEETGTKFVQKEVLYS